MGKAILFAVIGVLFLLCCAAAWVWYFMRDWDPDDPNW